MFRFVAASLARWRGGGAVAAAPVAPASSARRQQRSRAQLLARATQRAKRRRRRSRAALEDGAPPADVVRPAKRARTAATLVAPAEEAVKSAARAGATAATGAAAGAAATAAAAGTTVTAHGVMADEGLSVRRAVGRGGGWMGALPDNVLLRLFDVLSAAPRAGELSGRALTQARDAHALAATCKRFYRLFRSSAMRCVVFDYSSAVVVSSTRGGRHEGQLSKLCAFAGPYITRLVIGGCYEGYFDTLFRVIEERCPNLLEIDIADSDYEFEFSPALASLLLSRPWKVIKLPMGMRSTFHITPTPSPSEPDSAFLYDYVGMTQEASRLRQSQQEGKAGKDGEEGNNDEVEGDAIAGGTAVETASGLGPVGASHGDILAVEDGVLDAPVAGVIADFAEIDVEEVPVAAGGIPAVDEDGNLVEGEGDGAEVEPRIVEDNRHVVEVDEEEPEEYENLDEDELVSGHHTSGASGAVMYVDDDDDDEDEGEEDEDDDDVDVDGGIYTSPGIDDDDDDDEEDDDIVEEVVETVDCTDRSRTTSSRSLAHLENLTDIALPTRPPSCSDEAIGTFWSFLPNLRAISLSADLSPSLLAKLPDACPNIVELRLNMVARAREDSMAARTHLNAMYGALCKRFARTLQSLVLGWFDLDVAFISSLVSECTRLTSVELRDCRDVSMEVFKLLGPRLVAVHDTPLTISTMAALPALAPNLHSCELVIDDMLDIDMTDSAISWATGIASHRHVQHVVIKGCRDDHVIVNWDTVLTVMAEVYSKRAAGMANDLDGRMLPPAKLLTLRIERVKGLSVILWERLLSPVGSTLTVVSAFQCVPIGALEFISSVSSHCPQVERIRLPRLYNGDEEELYDAISELMDLESKVPHVCVSALRIYTDFLFTFLRRGGLEWSEPQ